MAFPVLGTLINDGTDIKDPSVKQLEKLRDPNQLQIMRQDLLRQLFTQETVSSADDVALQLAQIAQILGRSAGNEPTIYDNGSFRSSASGNANALTQQVERALTQVLGRTPGRGYDGFVTALNSAFPTDAYGQVMMTPTRSVVSLTGKGNYSNVGNGYYSPASMGNYPAAGSGYSPAPPNSTGVGQLSVEQANLYRQASINAADALRVLEALQPFDPKADIDAVEALRGLIRSQINTLVDEFGRIDEPRRELVEPYLDTLDSSIIQLGVQALLTATLQGVSPVTVSDETQIAGFELLRNYAGTLRTIFGQFLATKGTTVTGQYSERLSRSYIMLPVISDSNTSFMAAMDSIGFTASERRSDAALFSILKGLNPFETDNPGGTVGHTFIELPFVDQDGTTPKTPVFELVLPDITVNDFNEWVERFVTIEAPSILSASGQFGLNFVTDQADTLFWVIGMVLDAVKDDTSKNLLLGKVLSFERVQQTLSEFLFQLDTLADLGVGSTSTVNILSKVRGDKQTGAFGKPLLTALEVKVTNGGSGSPVSGVDLTFTVKEGLGGLALQQGQPLQSLIPVKTDPHGHAKVFWTLDKGPNDKNTVEVTGSGLSAVTFTATGKAGIPNKLGLSLEPKTTTQNGPVSCQATVQDEFGNTVTTAADVITFSKNNFEGDFSTPNPQTASNGIAQVFFIAKQTGQVQITASATGLTSDTASLSVS
jgi:hypothetical protein